MPLRPSTRIRYTLGTHDGWPLRLWLSLKGAAGDAPLQPFAPSWAWLQAQRSALSAADWRILRLLRELDAGWETRAQLDLKPSHLVELLPALAQSHRCFWQGASPHTPFCLGASRPAQLHWKPLENGQQRLEISIPGVECFPGPEAFYIDIHLWEIGQADCGATPEALRWVERGVVVNPGEFELFLQRHGEALQRARLPLPTDFPTRLWHNPPTPCLLFYSIRTHLIARQSYRRPALIDAIRASFTYLGPMGRVEFLAEHHAAYQYRYFAGVLHKIERDLSEEQRWLAMLEQSLLSLSPLEAIYQGAQFTDGVLPGDLCVRSAREWQQLLLTQAPIWREQGWHISIANAFRHHFVASERWRVHLEKDHQGRFALGLSAEIEGEKQVLLPTLLQTLAATPELADIDFRDDAELGAGSRGEDHILGLNDGRRVVIPADLLALLLQHLPELFDQPRLDKQGCLTLPASQAGRLALLAESFQRYWHDPQQLGATLPQTLEREAFSANAWEGLNAHLRDYQLQGVAWLRSLANRQLGGILADDMGLGKTLQMLAFLLHEKNVGHLQQPALVVAPTSVLQNWAREAQKFTPTLRCFVVHGGDRMAQISSHAQTDLFITSYALSLRDFTFWQSIPLSYLVLDEAHMIKNSSTKVAKALRQLESDHKFCMTGTPLENHLGELWSLFEFMMPGSLGSEARFKRVYRIPIEKHHNETRAVGLLQRIQPHILRRKKSEVAKELPSKTEVLIPITMTEPQREFYDALHALTQREITDLLLADGHETTRISILDALLRLRQLCCDPRLLPLEDAKSLPSAKLDHLLVMLEELVEEGRRILVFSQFTSMLALIREALQQRKIPHLLLTGATQNRQALVERFQAENEPIFLISLKAGGVGLNLTAADTVIHFDPWWNPAAEEQATDRAYRIGQDKPVFVYKLICEGTIEEKIVLLQERKRALQDAITGAAELLPAAPLSDEDLVFLLSQTVTQTGAGTTTQPSEAR
ncbi:predicted helicase [gamma proteobacterium HdN1]|nr:predicted helicase [gamma proteobacterium HdN1]